MVSKSQLGEDPNAPFRFEIGDRVARLTERGTPSEEFRGFIVARRCEGDPTGGVVKEIYKVRRHDGLPFDGEGFRLVRVTQESEDSSES